MVQNRRDHMLKSVQMHFDFLTAAGRYFFPRWHLSVCINIKRLHWEQMKIDYSDLKFTSNSQVGTNGFCWSVGILD